LLVTCQIDCVLDVGAHYGEFGRLLREIGYQGRIISFEPLPANFQRLLREIGHDSAWQAYNVALGSRAGRAELHTTRATNFSSFLYPSDYASATFAEQVAITHHIPVPIETLDTFLLPNNADRSQPHLFLKLDTQGWDLEVLRGAQHCLPAIVALQTELSLQALYEGMTPFIEMLDQLTSLGFEVSAFFPVVRDAALRLIEVDCVMVRPPGGH
jgi:FkbM family methyltransferase